MDVSSLLPTRAGGFFLLRAADQHLLQMMQRALDDVVTASVQFHGTPTPELFEADVLAFLRTRRQFEPKGTIAYLDYRWGGDIVAVERLVRTGARPQLPDLAPELDAVLTRHVR